MIRVRRAPEVSRAVDEIDALCAQIIEQHERTYHPGTYCLENDRGECFDAFGGTPHPFDEWRAKES